MPKTKPTAAAPDAVTIAHLKTLARQRELAAAKLLKRRRKKSGQ